VRYAIPLALLLAGCSNGPPNTVLDVTYDPCATTALELPEEATPDQRLAAQRALDLWSDVLGSTVSLEPEGATASVPIVFERGAPIFHGLYDDVEGVIYLNEVVEGEALAVTLAHELGHAFGLWHVAPRERSSVMNPGNDVVVPDATDAASVRALWPSCSD
jgi:hypothetical protein